MTSQPLGGSIGGARGAAPARANVALALLTLVYIFNFIDRQILNILAEPIARELQLNDTQIGLMTGLAFAVFYTFMGIPLARWADNPRSSRITLMAVCLVVWSGMTALSGLAQNFVQLLLARIGVGAGEAGCTPAAISMIADVFPAKKRASALGIYMMGVPIGSLVGLVAGGLLADAFGWRTAFLLVGLPGVVLAAVLILAVRDPRMEAGAAAVARQQLPFREVLKELSASRVYVLLITANTVGAFLAYGKGVWQIIFFIRSHHLTAGEVGLWLGLTAGTCGLIGSALGGRIGDYLGGRNPRHYFTVPAIGQLCAIPFLVAAYSVGDWRLALALLTVPAVVGTLNYGPGMATTQAIFRPQSRAMATAVKLFVQTLIGLGLGPLFFGVLSDALKPAAGEESVRQVLLCAAFLGVIPGVALLFAGRTLPAELARRAAADQEEA